jgi:hypothetical protein
MTHEKLLAQLDSSQVFGKRFGAKAYLALRAVVELHKPEGINAPAQCANDHKAYPCLTIQAIEKELN